MGEPATTAKIRLNTTNGDINVELWCKECPKTTRWFLNLFYDDKFGFVTIPKFEKNEYVQMYVETDEENSSELIAQFNKETNQRLRFTKRGLLCFGSFCDRKQRAKLGFFITLKPMPLENGNFTIFGKIVDLSIYNVIRISESEIDEDSGMPIYSTKILGYKVLVAYFKEKGLRENQQQKRTVWDENTKSKSLDQQKAKRQIKLIYDDDEEDSDLFMVKMKPVAKPKSKRQDKSQYAKKIRQDVVAGQNDKVIAENRVTYETAVADSTKAPKAAKLEATRTSAISLPLDDKEARDLLLFDLFEKKLADSVFEEQKVDKPSGELVKKDENEDEGEDENIDFINYRVEFA